MCVIDWMALGTMLMGTGAVGAVAVGYLTYRKQWGAAAKLAELEPELAEVKSELALSVNQLIVLISYRELWFSGDHPFYYYPDDELAIAQYIVASTATPFDEVKEILKYLDSKRLLFVARDE